MLSQLTNTCRVCLLFLSDRMSCRADVLLRCLLKLLLDVSSDSDLGDSIRRSLMSEAALCIKLLDGCCHGNLQVSLPAGVSQSVAFKTLH